MKKVCTLKDLKEKDRKLENWQKWISIRRKFYDRVQDILNRKPMEFLMNSCEHERLKIEDRLVMEYAKLPQKYSSRGCPGFWKLPAAFIKHPSLMAVMTKQDKCITPLIEYIGTPAAIKLEKQLPPDEIVSKNVYFKSKYRKRELHSHQKEIVKIEPHVPNTNELVIIGNKKDIEIEPETEDFLSNLRNPQYFSVGNSETEEKIIRLQNYDTDTIRDSNADINTTDVRMSLQIEDTIYTPNEPQINNAFKLFVNYQIGVDHTITNKIVLKNIGTASLKYYWIMHIPERVLEDLVPHRLPECKFIFNKAVSIILPGETKPVEIYLKTSSVGYSKEVWEMCTIPNIFTSGKYTMTLVSYAEIAKSEETEAAILDRIYDGMMQTAIAETLMSIVQDTNILISKRAYQIDDTVQYTQKEIFESINAEFGPPGSSPKIYHYEKTLVQKLRTLYNDLIFSLRLDTLGPWNYKIADLYLLVNEVMDNKERDTYRMKIDEIVNKLYVTNMIENIDDYKYFAVYNLLCIMVDKITTFVYEIRSYYNYPLIERYPPITEETLYKQNQKLENEYRTFSLFPDFYQEEYLENECKIKEFDRPPLEILKSIPFEDVTKRFIEYHKIINPNKVIEAETSGRTSKARSKSKKSSIKTLEKKDLPGRKLSAITVDKVKKPVFPTKPKFVEESLTNLLTDEIVIKPSYIIDNIGELFSENSEMYYINIYSVVYGLLCKTVTEIAALLDRLNSSKHVSRRVLKQCIDIGICSLTDISKHKKELPTYKLKHMFKSDSNLSQKSSELLLPSLQETLSKCSSMHSNLSEDLSFESSEALISKTYVNAQTETDYGILYTPKIRSTQIQTDFGDDEFDLVAIIEREISCTSVQRLVTKYNKATQIDQCRVCRTDESETEINN